ncbi:glutamate--tRNA ligase [Caldivirga sp. UBA161]|uniref:glutamate--tRNA ligase n=1 Tax=Caldivirga sp. UBA161 TaxID=1915569 RepID=UPI0025BCBAC5|nr:glutamate--tRNA ligase [Caldivirga sp. UBA161]
MESDVRDLALKHALINAVRFNGKADVKAVVSKIFADNPELRSKARQVVEVVSEVVNYVNSLTLDEQRRILKERWPEALGARKSTEERRGDIESLPELPDADKLSKLVFRFAPNPDFYLHLGSARPAIVNYAYKLKYANKGKDSRFILRFEDTDPRIKRPLLDAYDAIKEDLRWLGVKWDEEYIQSDRMNIYYEYARRLIEIGGAYVVAKGSGCEPDEWKRLKIEGKPCLTREAESSRNLEFFDKMLDGAFNEGEAIVAVKTDLSSPDPSIRDWVAFRVIDAHKYPHPRVGDKYVVWPTYNFAVAIDDHLMGITHVLRAQEHRVNTVKQYYVFKAFGWEQPYTIHFGRLKIEGLKLSKSILKKLNLTKDDVTLPTLAGLRNRGITPEAIWSLILFVGIKETDASISLKNLYAYNRRIIEPLANRYMFVKNPVKLRLKGVGDLIEAKIPMHPSYPERGFRVIKITGEGGYAEVYVQASDVKPGLIMRLLGLGNIKVSNVSGNEAEADFIGQSVEDARRSEAPIVQWVPVDAVNAEVIVPVNVGQVTVDNGLAEPTVAKLEQGTVMQFIRYGFVKLMGNSNSKIRLVYIHD